jgi:predicted nuclease with TOPRIM domain
MTKQITAEELSQVNSLNTRYNQVFLELGQNVAQTKEYLKVLETLNTEANALHEDYEHIKKEEAVLVEILNAKYGVGQLDLVTGVLSVQG